MLKSGIRNEFWSPLVEVESHLKLLLFLDLHSPNQIILRLSYVKVLLVYVNDILIAWPNLEIISQFKTLLHQRFKFKDI